LSAFLNYWQDDIAVAFGVNSASCLLPRLIKASLTFCAKDARALIVNIFYSVHIDSYSAASTLPKHAF
jgi:Na+/H+-dicarboxylate symporter